MYENIHFPGWEVVRKIGEGSFGGVYEIHRTLPDGRVEKAALKKLTVPKDNSEIRELYSQSFSKENITAHYKDQMQGLVNEYTLTQELNGCRNVVACHEVQCVQHADGIGWDIYIRMELLKPLKQVLSIDYHEATVLKLGLSLCSALLACQEHHIIHRDIKPENILVSDRGEFKLGDFGIAKVSEKTATGTMTGTMGYMAPEVANRWHYGAQADIYSLGMVLYWMMNRRTLPFLPFPPAIPTAAQRQEAANRRFAGESFPPPVNGSRELKAIVMKACAFSTEDRYQTVRELRRDLYACYQQRRAGKKPDVSIPVSTDEAIWTSESTSGNTYSGSRIIHSNSQNEKTGTLKPDTRKTGTLNTDATKTGASKTNDPKTGRFSAPPERPKKRRVALICILVALCLCFASTTGYLLVYGFRLVRQSASTRETEVDISDTSAPTQETIPPTTTESIVYNENIGTITNQISVRVIPSKDANITGTLDAGTVVEILRQETTADVTWGMISSPVNGWICMDYVKMYSSQSSSVDNEADFNTSQPTTPTPSGNSNTTNNNGAQGTKGVITASSLDVRDEASASGKIVGSYFKGDVVTILETKDGWGRTSKGWIKMEYVNNTGTPPGSNTTNTTTGNNNNTHGNGSTTTVAKGIVNTQELNIRSSAGTDGDRVGSLKYGDRVEILEKSGDWGRISKGWIPLNYVYQDGTTGSKSAKGIVTIDGLRIRSGPGITYESVGSYNSGDRVKVLEQFTYGDTTWGCTDKGWISMGYVYQDGTDVGKTVEGIVTTDELDIRSGPGTGYDSVCKLYTDEVIKIFYQVTVGETTWGCTNQGWVSLKYVSLEG